MPLIFLDKSFGAPTATSRRSVMDGVTRAIRGRVGRGRAATSTVDVTSMMTM